MIAADTLVRDADIARLFLICKRAASTSVQRSLPLVVAPWPSVMESPSATTTAASPQCAHRSPARLIPVVHLLRVRQVRRTHMVAMRVVGRCPRARTPRLLRRRRVQMKARGRSESDVTGISTASETYSAPGGIVTSGLPGKGQRTIARGIDGRAPPGDAGCAICTEVKCSAAVPKAFDRCTRKADPPSDKCTSRARWHRASRPRAAHSAAPESAAKHPNSTPTRLPSPCPAGPARRSPSTRSRGIRGRALPPTSESLSSPMP